MRCPVCLEEMLVLEYNSVEIDFCNECEGVWLDEGELELLLGDNIPTDSPLYEALNGFAKNAKKGSRPCPVCSKKMLLVDIPVGDDKFVEIDKCRYNHGLWFDKGELDEILSAGKGEAVTSFLNDIFGTEK